MTELCRVWSGQVVHLIKYIKSAKRVKMTEEINEDFEGAFPVDYGLPHKEKKRYAEAN